MAQEYSQTSASTSATCKESFTQLSRSQRQSVELQQLLQLFISFKVTLALSICTSTQQSEKCRPFAFSLLVTLPFTHATTSHERKELHTFAFSFAVTLASKTETNQKLLSISLSSAPPRTISKLFTLAVTTT